MNASRQFRLVPSAIALAITFTTAQPQAARPGPT